MEKKKGKRIGGGYVSEELRRTLSGLRDIAWMALSLLPERK